MGSCVIESGRRECLAAKSLARDAVRLGIARQNRLAMRQI